MQPDYYHILRIPLNARIDIIRRAYRQRAMQCHPDRGGTHEQMLLVNEAWGILSDSEARRHYDYARAHAADAHVHAAAAADAQYARERAEHYPRKWADFAAWLDKKLTHEIGELGGFGASLAARFLPTETFSASFELSSSASDVLKFVFQVLSQIGHLNNEFSSDSSVPQLAAIIGSGFLHLNPTFVQVSVVPKSDCSSIVSIIGAAKEGLIKQRSAEKAVRRVEHEIRKL